MGEISTTGFKFLSVHKKLDLELEKNIKKIDREAMKRRHTLYVETEGVRRDMHKMFNDAKDIDTIFGPEFTDDIARKMFPSSRKSSATDQLIPKSMSYTLTQARNAMKELKKLKSREKKLQTKMNRIRKKNMSKRLKKTNEDEEKELSLIVDSIRRLTVFVANDDNQEPLLPQINESDSAEAQAKNDEKEPRSDAQKMSSRRWKVLKISRELSLPIINKRRNISVKIPRCTMDNDKNNSKQERPKMPERNSIDLSTLPAISLAKKKQEDNVTKPQTDKPIDKKEEKSEDCGEEQKSEDGGEKQKSEFMISKYISEVHGNLPKEILLEIERMVKEESFILDK